MRNSYDLTHLDPNAFEHLVNLLSIRVLGPGHTGFSPGADGGRDGYFEGEAPYPSDVERWSGVWYIQSKFHKPSLSTKDPQKWLINQIKEEIRVFKSPESKRRLPDNWIIATNIEPSGVPETGAFDRALELVEKELPSLQGHFHIWGGRKILDYLALNPQIANYYKHFITPGNVLAEIFEKLNDERAEVEDILRFLILSQFEEQQYTKLEQAGSEEDTRPGIHNLFIDLPFKSEEHNVRGLTIDWLVRTAARCHRVDDEQTDSEEWLCWERHPSRAKVWFIKGGPGQGKSTIGQYFCQIQRAALILQKDIKRLTRKQNALATEIRKVAEQFGFWPLVPRIPIYIELKEFAQWFGEQDKNSPKNFLTYLSKTIYADIGQEVPVGMLKRLLGSRSWFVVFDGLDEVPQDVKDLVALEVCRFVNDTTVSVNADVLTICTSRPQGYSGQFSNLDGSTIELVRLSPKQALDCAKPILGLGRTQSESKKAVHALTVAIQSPSVCELMTTPLQAHIMAVVVRGGQRPPERRWKLFKNFYQVIKKREENRALPDKKIVTLLQKNEQLLKTVHNRLGFVLHSKAESSSGAQTRLSREEFNSLVEDAVLQMLETEVEKTIAALTQTTIDRLVLVNSPEDGNYVRFDVRQLQEFFAAEFLYESVTLEQLHERFELIMGDAHWREVSHFLLSALIENQRTTELAVAVKVLTELHEDDNEETRLLQQRLGRGAVLAARLLHEGVLEEDSRVRNQFRNSLEPLAASTEIALLRPLVLVNQPNSESWLHNFLISCLEEKNPTESIGAAITLVQVLPDGHGKVEKVISLLNDAPPDFLSHLLVSYYSEISRESRLDREKVFPIKKWFLKFITKFLLSSQWSSLTKNALSSAIYFLASNYKESISVFSEELVFSEEQLFRILIDGGRQRGVREIKTIFNSEVVEIIALQSNWAEMLPDSVFLELSTGTPEILQIVHFIAYFAKTFDKADLLKVYQKLGRENYHLLDSFSSSLKVPLYNEDLHFSFDEQIAYITSISDATFSKEYQIQEVRTRPGYLGGRLEPEWGKRKSDNSSYLNALKELVNDYPNIALSMWANSNPTIFADKNFTSLLIDVILARPQVMRQYSGAWGKFLVEAPHRESDLRVAILAAASGKPSEEMFSPSLIPFALNLPLEAPLLPHLVNSLLSRRRFRSLEAEASHQLEIIKGKVSKLVPDTSSLKSLVNESDLSIEIRAAALILSLLHFNCEESISDYKELMVEFYQCRANRWYINAITFLLYSLSSEKESTGRWIMSRLLVETRADYESRSYLHELLALWRESSYAPIQTKNVQQKWVFGS